MNKIHCFEIYTRNPLTLEGGWNIVVVRVNAPNMSREQAESFVTNGPLFDKVLEYWNE